LLEPLEFFVEGVSPGATIEAELFIPDNFNEQTDAYMRFNYKTQRFEEYVDANGQKLYQLLDENGDGKVDRIIFSLTDGDPAWDGDGLANGTIIDPGSPIDAAIQITGGNKRDRITGNLLANTIRGKGGNDQLDGDLGRDVITGDKGNDRITGGEHGDYLKGGAGKDRFIYHSAADSSADNPYQRDEIARFQKHDRIDLRRFDADSTQAGTQRFDFIGTRFFSGQSGELRFHSGILAADLDGDRQADFAVAIDGNLNAKQLLLGS
jgi:Ca2+-binding RTX toxin-like protein